MATQPALMSIETYLHTAYRPDVDFVDGHIEERSVGEYEHSRLQHMIARAIGPQDDEGWEFEGLIEQRIRVAPHRVRVCDITYVRSETPHERVVKTPPFLCIEILSPEDRLSRAQVVLRDYLQMGVAHIWLLDPVQEIAYTFDEQGLHIQEGELAISGVDIRLNYRVIFARFKRALVK